MYFIIPTSYFDHAIDLDIAIYLDCLRRQLLGLEPQILGHLHHVLGFVLDGPGLDSKTVKI